MSTDGHEFYEHKLSDQKIRQIRDACRAFLRKKRANEAELVEEYIEEAEHQESDTYWADYFYKHNSILYAAILADFDLYVQNVRESVCEAVQLGDISPGLLVVRAPGFDD